MSRARRTKILPEEPQDQETFDREIREAWNEFSPEEQYSEAEWKALIQSGISNVTTCYRQGALDARAAAMQKREELVARIKELMIEKVKDRLELVVAKECIKNISGMVYKNTKIGEALAAYEASRRE